MTAIKIHGKEYPATVEGRVRDRDFDDRESCAIRVQMMHAEACALFVDGLPWSLVYREDVADEAGQVQTVETEYDKSEFSVAGPITDMRDGYVLVKMGKPTEMETVLAAIMEDLKDE